MIRSVRTLQAATVLVLVALDQLVKMLIRERLPFGNSIEVIPGLLDLTRVHNTGAAFGMLNAIDFPYKPVIIPLVAAAALAGLAFYASTLDASQRLSRIGLTFVVAGAAGNLIDRIAYGYVLDFVDFYWNDWHFWAFNVADASISVGVVFMILDLLGAGRLRVSRTV
jgi:signal peptidase II